MEESSSSDVLAVAVSSTVIGSLVVSLLTFIAGDVCGHYFRCRKYCKESTEKIPAVALHEDVNVLSNTVNNQERDVELKENVAYGPSKSMMVTVEQ